MIKEFELQTKPLSEMEKNETMPFLITILQKSKSKATAITNQKIKQELQRNNLWSTAPRIRAMIHVIRITGAVQNLIATSHGYYTTNNLVEIDNYIETLRCREESIKEIRKVMIIQKITLKQLLCTE